MGSQWPLQSFFHSDCGEKPPWRQVFAAFFSKQNSSQSLDSGDCGVVAVTRQNGAGSFPYYPQLLWTQKTSQRMRHHRKEGPIDKVWSEFPVTRVTNTFPATMAINVEFSIAHGSHSVIGKDAHGFALCLSKSINR